MGEELITSTDGSKSQRVFLTVLHFALAALLIWAMRKHGYNYYVFLRLAVCAGSIYIAYYYWCQQAWVVSAIFAGLVVLFNPFVPFVFSKHTWSIIDFAVAIVFVLTGLAYFKLTGSLLGGAVLCLIGGWFGENAISDVLLAIRLSDGAHTIAALIDVQEQIDDCDSCPGQISRTYDVSYDFQTASGQSIKGFANVGYDPSQDNPRTVAVIYNPANPNESRLEEARQSTVLGAIVIGGIKCLVAIALCCFGVTAIRLGVQKARNG